MIHVTDATVLAPGFLSLFFLDYPQQPPHPAAVESDWMEEKLRLNLRFPGTTAPHMAL